MSHDLQMARGHGKGFNLAIGEPFFLQETLLDAIRLRSIKRELHYPQVGGEPELIDLLNALHFEYKYVVVTNGAKQGLEAAFYAMKKVEDRINLRHLAPYWPSYPTLAKARGLAFVPVWDGGFGVRREYDIRVVTSPNNPDGSELFEDEPYDIWDAAYASDVYGWSGVPPDHRVAVFSAAKMLGLSGARVGWVCTNDEKIAREVGYFVEITTSGVSVLSQLHVAGCLHGMFNKDYSQAMLDATAAAQARLHQNGDYFMDSIAALCTTVDGQPKSRRGMFAWFKPLNLDKFEKALAASEVRVVTGEACGLSGWFRMSMGHRNQYTLEALTALRTAYDAI